MLRRPERKIVIAEPTPREFFFFTSRIVVVAIVAWCVGSLLFRLAAR